MPEVDWLAVVGSRSFYDYRRMYEVLADFKLRGVISGGARGADTLAERYAKERGLSLMVFRTDWERYGRNAGFRRNLQVLQKADEVVAFWDGESPGTAYTIRTARRQGKKVHIHRF